jgi:hypothetical protein
VVAPICLIKAPLRCIRAAILPAQQGTRLVVVSHCSTKLPQVTDRTSCFTSGQYKLDIYYTAAQWVGPDPKAYDLGCYALPQDWKNNGLVNASFYNFPSNSLTRDTCAQACAQKNAKWAATRDTLCYCGNDFDVGQGYFIPDDFCARPCGGNKTQMCGDYYRMNIFNLTAYDRSAAPSSSVRSGYSGCFAEGNGKLALQGYSFSDNKLTTDMCMSYCNQLGFSLAGARNGNQCYCDSVFQGGQSLPDSECSAPCVGNSTQRCGDTYTLSLFKSNASTYGAEQAVAAHAPGWQGCFASTLITTKVAYSEYTLYPPTLNVSSCRSTCAYFGYKYAALWASSSCNCGNQLVTSGRAPDAYCNTPCKSDSKATCGGGNHIEVYSVDESHAPDTSALKAQGWLGCFNNPTNGTALGDYSFTDSSMTPDLCRNGCRQVSGYNYSGVQGSVCNCGNKNLGVLQPPSSCSRACPGNDKQICGDAYSYSIYNATVGNATAVVGKGSAWTGCFREAVGYRALSGYTFSSNAMTSALCRKACALREYALAGTQYSVQ